LEFAQESLEGEVLQSQMLYFGMEMTEKQWILFMNLIAATKTAI